MTNTVAFAFCMICSYIYIVFNAHTWKTQLKTEHVSEAERCDAQLNIPLCGRAFHSAHRQKQCERFNPLTWVRKTIRTANGVGY